MGWMGYLLGPTLRAPYGANNTSYNTVFCQFRGPLTGTLNYMEILSPGKIFAQHGGDLLRGPPRPLWGGRHHSLGRNKTRLKGTIT